MNLKMAGSGLIFSVTFCSNRNTLTFDSKVYIWNNLSGVKCIVIHVVSPLPLVRAHTKICPNIENPLL